MSSTWVCSVALGRHRRTVARDLAISIREGELASEITPCRICESRGPHERFLAREMMFGTGESFGYFECSECGTVQIVNIVPPAELSRYYPAGYYSLITPNPGLGGWILNAGSWPKRWLRAQRDRYSLGIPNCGGKVIALFKAEDPVLSMIRAMGITQSGSILDVGCGANGWLLDSLARCGFRHLIGIDPYIREDTRTKSGVPILKRFIGEMSSEFDLIMFHHSFEHAPDPIGVLASVRQRLTCVGKCLVRIPTPSSDAWVRYKSKWVQLDAPRHLVLPSRKGMAILAQKSGLTLEQ